MLSKECDFCKYCFYPLALLYIAFLLTFGQLLVLILGIYLRRISPATYKDEKSSNFSNGSDQASELALPGDHKGTWLQTTPSRGCTLPLFGSLFMICLCLYVWVEFA